jgi:hypothetical protein
MRKFLIVILAVILIRTIDAGAAVAPSVHDIFISKENHPRTTFGALKIKTALEKINIQGRISVKNQFSSTKDQLLIGIYTDVIFKDKLSAAIKQKIIAAGKEGFYLYRDKNNIFIIGADASGTLYGCLEFAELILKHGKIPTALSLADHPEMVLRGTCIGLQKPDYLPGHDVYEYPYTPETFPWLYDKELWIKYLDMMVDNRYNSLYLWNGHPFSSLIKLKEYPYAVEVDDATFKKNEEIFKFLTTEADKRGIWIIQMFYNIIIPKPFADKHGLKTQDRNRPIVPLIADYTRKSIAAFVEKYPNVGLMVALGEAMEGVGQDDIDWFTKTIIPGVQDGLKAANIKDEPPIVLRAHDTDAPSVMKAALPLYRNLYTENKFNGEALTTYEPRGAWAELNRKLAKIGTINISNVHILANLEPFRYGSADFIQKSVQAMNENYGAKGLHLYPQASYWDWPYTADMAKGRILEVDRDWIWYKEWARYAWNSKRERPAEVNYWSEQLADKYGTDLQSGKAILDAYEASGEISPKLLRRYGITDGNRQTLTLGMLMTQLINPFRYGLFTLLYESEAPEGEMIIDYAEKEWKKQGHIGETPLRVAEEVVAHGAEAIAAINKVKPVAQNQEEFRRLKNDIYCYDAMANFYADKVKSALWILRYKYSNQVSDLEKALPLLKRSIEHYTELVKLTNEEYLYANSMQTKQRKIPMRGVDKTFIHWKEMLPVYTKELSHFKHSIDSLKQIKPGAVAAIVPYVNADVEILTPQSQTISVAQQVQVYADTNVVLKEITPVLIGLKGLKLAMKQQIASGTTIKFKNKQAVKVLVAFYNQKDPRYLQPPQLEIDASANNYGQAEIKISNALVANGFPPANVHAYSFPAGTNTLTLAKGACLILGFIPDQQELRIFNAGLDGRGKDIDWLFE